MTGLEVLGWTPAWAEAFAALATPGLVPARVVLEHGRFLRVNDGVTESLAVPSGRLKHETESAAAMPTVGDWVALTRTPGDELASIRHLLPRKSRFSRRRAGHRVVEQVVAANVDLVLLMMGLDADFNLRRLERYLSLAWASGARPAIVLNKADLATDLPARLAEVRALGVDLPVVTTQLRDAEAGHAAVLPLLQPTETVALLGSSGVGKSTLLNRLAGAERQRTNDVRASDGRGRHTTTYSQLFTLPNGALMVDTPGMRELQLWDAGEGIETTFADVEALAAACHFRDCRHEGEPDCAVRAALADGRLPRERFDSFFKLRAETAPPPRGARLPRTPRPPRSTARGRRR